MGVMSDVEKFQLWESNGYELYYRLRDLELHLQCLKESSESIRAMVKDRSKKDLSVKVMQNILSRLRDRIKETKQICKDIEESIE